MKVHVAIPPIRELYPIDGVLAGLRRLGHRIIGNQAPLDADFLVVWSPWARSRREALFLSYKRAGKPVLVMENGWLSPIHGVPYFQVAHDGWNGTGHYLVDNLSRWDRWNLVPLPWIEPRPLELGHRALVIGQRGHLFDHRTSMPGWHRMLQIDGLPEGRIIRRDRDASLPLQDELVTADSVHTWSSNAASWAIMYGVPVVHYGENLMVKAMTSRPGGPFWLGDREPALRRLAWAQWSLLEIEGGEPFARLLEEAA